MADKSEDKTSVAEEPDYDEQVCTFDFSVDEDAVNSEPAPPPRFRKNNKSPPVIAREYEGEDYSKYLEDEPPPLPPLPQQNPYLLDGAQAGTKRDKRQSAAPQFEYDQPYPPEYLIGGAIENQRRPADAIKDRVNKWLNTVRRPPSRAQLEAAWEAAYPASRMANFSYADSKIGLSAAEEFGPTGPGSDSGIGTFSTAYNSDLGAGAQSVGGWSDSAASHYTKRDNTRDSGYAPPPPAPRGVGRKVKSSSNLHAESEVGTVRQRHRSASRSGRDDAASSLSGVSVSSNNTSKKLSTVWKKFTNTVSRGRKVSRDPQQGNMSYNSEYEDLRL